MKKIVSMLLVLVMVFALCACSSKPARMASRLQAFHETA